MNVTCSAKTCPVLLDAACVFYEGQNLLYIGVHTNDTLEVALQKINATVHNLSFINVAPPITYIGNIIGITQSGTSSDGYLSNVDWNTFNNKQDAITLTTIGTSGAATLIGSTLNIPQYQGVITNPITGTGTVDFIPVFTSASTIGNGFLKQSSIGKILIDGSSNLSEYSLQVGQGRTTNGYAYFDLIGDAAYTDYGLRIQRGNSGANAPSTIVHRGTGLFSIETNEDAAIQFGNSFTPAMYIAPSSGGSNILMGSIIDDGINKIQINGYSIATGYKIPSGTSAQYLKADGSVSTLTNPITGTGTLNYISKFTSTGSTIGNSLLYDGGSGVSIGSTTVARLFNIYSATPDNHLLIAGNAPSVSMANAMIGATYQAKFGLATSSNQFVTNSIAGDFTITSQGTSSVLFGVNSVEALRVFGVTRNISINGNSTDSGQRLQVNGTVKITDELTLGSTITNGTYTYTLPSATGTLALTSSLGGYVPTSRELTINGTTYDLSANRSWSINSMVYPSAGIAVSTGSAWGTSIVDNSTNWNTAYSLRITSASSPLNITSNVISISQSDSTTNGYLSSTDWTTFNSKQPALSGTGFVKISGTTISYDNSTYYLASNPNAYIALTALSASSPLSYDNTTGVFSIQVANTTQSGYLTSTDWNTFSNKQEAITLTVTGSSGASTLVSNTLNIPTYTLSGLGGQPLSTNLTSLAGLSYASSSFVKMTAAGTFTLDTSSYLTSNIYTADGTLTSNRTISSGDFTLNIAPKTTFSSSVTASAALAQGTVFTPTLAAAANSDVLVGLDVNPIFTNGAFTSVQNIGIRSQVASATGKWNLYMSGTAINYLNGALLIGSTTDNGTDKLQVTGSMKVIGSTGNFATFARNGGGDYLSLYDTSSTLNNYLYQTFTSDTTGTGAATQVTFGRIGVQLITKDNATYKSDFRLQVSNNGTLTEQFRVFSAGDVYIPNGSLVIGGSVSAGFNVVISKNISGAVSSFGIYQNGTVQSGVTSQAHGNYNVLNTQAASFTLGTYSGFTSTQSTIGSGSTVNNIYGFYATSSLGGAANNTSGFFSNVPVNGSLNWNFYANNTAPNYFAATTNIGSTSLAASAILNVTSTTKGFLPPRMTTTQKNAISSPATGLVVYDTTLNKLAVYTGAAWETVTSL